MGITGNCSKFLLYAKAQGISYQKTLMLGRQHVYFSQEEVEQYAKHFKLNLRIDSAPVTGVYAEPLFKALGAELVESLDFSTFENASIIHNLNTPLPGPLRSKFTVVFDGGTLEHVFNFPVAVKSCMDALQVGGHFIAISPTNNQSGHGFYQFSPELFFSLFAEKNGFRMKLLLIAAEIPGAGIVDWFQVQDPREVKKRVTLNNDHPTFLMVLAEKVSETPGTIVEPNQSDYEFAWHAHTARGQNNSSGKSSLRQWYSRFTPGILKKMIARLLKPYPENRENMTNLGDGNPDFFKKFEV